MQSVFWRGRLYFNNQQEPFGKSCEMKSWWIYLDLQKSLEIESCTSLIRS